MAGRNAQIGVPGAGKQAGQRVFASTAQATLTVTSTATSRSLPDVVIPAGALTGKTIDRVIVTISWRKSVESSGVANAVNVEQMIQVRDDSPSAWVDAITIPDNSLAHAIDEVGPGFMLVGNTDVSNTVDGEDTYNVQWELSDVDGDSIVFHDIQAHLIVYFT